MEILHECSWLNGGLLPIPLQRYVHLEPVNVTVFGKRIFEDVVKLRLLRCDHPESEWALNQMSIVLKREEKTQGRRSHEDGV